MEQKYYLNSAKGFTASHSHHETAISSQDAALVSTQVYNPLPTIQAIRLLHLNPGAGNEPLVASLETYTIQNAPPYEAMSYAWGNPSPTLNITVDGFAFPIRSNLHRGLLRVRNESTMRTLWTDAICIDQANIQERSQQVSIIGLIFEGASRVLVWLGEDEREESKLVISLLHDIGSRVDNNPTESCTLGQMLRPKELSQLETEAWSAVARVLNQPWFRRVWTLQEIGLAIDAVMFYGRAEFTFDVILKVLCFLDTDGQLFKPYFNIKLHARYGFCFFFYKGFDPDLLRRYARSRLQIADFLAVLKYARDFGASEAQDRIYAFNGLSTTLTGIDHVIGVDYNKTRVETFTEFATKYIKQPSGLRILCHVDTGRLEISSDQAPSWAPMWDKVKNTHELGSKLHFYYAGGLYDPPHLYISDGVLRVRGCIFDTVTWTYIPFYGTDFDIQPSRISKPGCHSLELLWNEMIRNITTSQSPYEDLHVAFSLTLAAGLWGLRAAEDNLSTFFTCFCAYLQQIASSSSSELDHSTAKQLHRAASGSDWTQYMLDAQRACQNRIFFCTARGYFGIGPTAMQAGDVCCVFLGSGSAFHIATRGYSSYPSGRILCSWSNARRGIAEISV